MSPSTNPLGPVYGFGRVLRGGSWYNDSNLVRSSSRDYYPLDTSDDFFGFRVARAP
jgi:formylglycine-generating enzyme required for sulfatase activity